ncbi:response regulator [Paenibacillus filicis]|uniref:Response regulator n=1 Tax=Paenibacillus filicis TaxID=669464 RepID=A0ABU9DUR7_9BACL
MFQRWLNIIVVDDELPLRQELRSFPWGEWGAVLAGEAENGTEALRLCRDCVPDVVVTDITMPLMDGLELTKQIKREFPAVQVILLTCHSDFHYAREALKLGALEYLVKVTLEESELEQAIGRAREAIGREHAHRRQTLDQQRREQAKTIGRLLKDKQPVEELIVADLSRCGMLPQLPARLAMIQVQSGEEDRVFIEQEIQSALDNLESSFSPSFCWVPVCSTEYALFFPDGQPAINQLKLSLEAVVRGLGQALDTNLPFLGQETAVFGVISESLASGTEFLEAFGQIKRWQQARFYEQEAGQAVFVGKPVPLSPLDKAQAALLLEGLSQLGGSDGIAGYIRTEFVRACLKHRYEPEALKQAVERFFQERPGAAAAAREDLSDIRQAATLGELADAMHRLTVQTNGRKGRLRQEVHEAKQYIAGHLHEPVTLQLVAEHVALSPHYLSRLFREEVGESVLEYMTRLRIGKAIQLLEQTNLKVYEVADRVGIPSYRYFSTLFRSWTGVPPTDYKKQQGGQAVDEDGGEAQ